MNDSPHPLASTLAELLRERNTQRQSRFALLLGGGSGRSIPPLLEEGLGVDVVEEDAARIQALNKRFSESSRVHIAQGNYEKPDLFHRRYMGILSTHALLHKTRRHASAVLRTLADILLPDAHILLTLGSVRDQRFGQGRRIDTQTWAPISGPEADVAHTYYDDASVLMLLQPYEIISLREVHAREIVGTWAHDLEQTPDIVHWYVHAKLPLRHDFLHDVSTCD